MLLKNGVKICLAIGDTWSVLDPKEFVERLVILSKESRPKAIDMVYKLDILLEAGEFNYFSSVIDHLLNVDDVEGSIHLSFLTVMLPFQEKLEETYKKLRNHTYNKLTEKYDEEYAAKCLVGFL